MAWGSLYPLHLLHRAGGIFVKELIVLDHPQVLVTGGMDNSRHAVVCLGYGDGPQVLVTGGMDNSSTV